MNWLLVGASRGLGLEFAKLVQGRGDLVTILSRKPPKPPFEARHVAVDLSKEVSDQVFHDLTQQNFDGLVYFAGGGPYGPFESKKFSDHQWAWNVTFQSAALFLHWSLGQQSFRKLCFIGSAVAEDQPDLGAASYCAAKHALKGLVSSVQLELNQRKKEVQLTLFSPGYMDTQLLPQNALPRQQGLAENPADVAQKLMERIYPVC